MTWELHLLRNDLGNCSYFEMTWGIAVTSQENTFQPAPHTDVTIISLVTVNEIHCFSLNEIGVSHHDDH